MKILKIIYFLKTFIYVDFPYAETFLKNIYL